MVWLVAMLVGVGLGAATALRRGGRKLDALQYAAGYGIAFGLLGFVASLVIFRLF